MTSSLIRFDSDALEALADVIDRAASDIDEHLTKLTQEVGSLAWDGRAQAAYAEAHRQWSAVLVEMNIILRDARVIASGTVENFVNVDRAAMDMWAS